MKDKILNKINKFNKNNIIQLFAILGMTFLLCNGFLQMHYSSDTYVLLDLGYFEYPFHYFLPDGRFVSAAICFLGGMLKLPFSVYIVALDFLGIIFIGLSIYLLSKLFESLIKPENFITKLLLIACSFMIILNQFALEYLLFPESAVMCFGLLFIIIAVKTIMDDSKHKYLKIFLALMIAGLCYQGLLNIFPVLAFLVYAIKQMKDPRENKVKTKEFIIEMFKLAAICFVVLCICIGVVTISLKILDSYSYRSGTILNIKILQENRKAALFACEIILWKYSLHMLPVYANTIILIISIILILMPTTRKEAIIYSVLILILIFTSIYIPMILFGICATGRANVPLTMMWGIFLTIILTQTTMEKDKKTIFVYLAYGFIITSFMTNNIILMQNITQHIAANKVEDNMGMMIKNRIEEYEEETGIIVTKFGYIYDLNHTWYSYNIKQMSSMTERKFSCPWSIKNTMNYYCGRKFEYVDCFEHPEKYNIDFATDKDYDVFSEDQLVFEGDTVYLIVF